jgi:hypothetical protein
MRKRFGRVVLATVAAAGLTLSMNPAALAGGPYLWANHDYIGKRFIVCADSLAVRHSKGGPAFAYLHKNQTFTVENPGTEEFGGEWVYGFAWGTVHSRGYVENGWFWDARAQPRCVK